MIYKNASELIGRTPMMYLDNICNEENCNCRIAAKLERANPTGSAKDRAVLRMIEEAETAGLLRNGSTIIEPTSGNAGISIAMLGGIKDYRVILTMPESMSKERISILQAYGAQIVLTSAELGMNGAIEKAKELSEQIENSIMLEQFSNMGNPYAHYLTTAPEIWKDTEGKLSYLVAGVGTGGTLCGCAKFLKEKNPQIRITAVEPQNSAVLLGKEKGAHRIQGIGAGFVPDTCDLSLIDEVIAVSDETAYSFCRKLVRKEGLLCGISSGAALAAAVEIAKRDETAGELIAVILPDAGERYLSEKGLFSAVEDS